MHLRSAFSYPLLLLCCFLPTGLVACAHASTPEPETPEEKIAFLSDDRIVQDSIQFHEKKDARAERLQKGEATTQRLSGNQGTCWLVDPKSGKRFRDKEEARTWAEGHGVAVLKLETSCFGSKEDDLKPHPSK